MLYLEFGVIKELLLIKSIKNSEHVIDKLEKRSLYARKCFSSVSESSCRTE